MEIKPPEATDIPLVSQKKEEKPNLPQNNNDSGVPTSGKRAAFKDIRRQITETELTNPGVQKLLLDMLEEADMKRGEAEVFIERFHEADKKASILEEKLISNQTIEIFFGVGVGLGGTIIGLSPFFLSLGNAYGIVCVVLGLALLVGAVIGRVFKK